MKTIVYTSQCFKHDVDYGHDWQSYFTWQPLCTAHNTFTSLYGTQKVDILSRYLSHRSFLIKQYCNRVTYPSHQFQMIYILQRKIPRVSAVMIWYYGKFHKFSEHENLSLTCHANLCPYIRVFLSPRNHLIRRSSVFSPTECSFVFDLQWEYRYLYIVFVS